MKGYPTQSGYMGWIHDTYILFANEEEYIEAFLEAESEED